MCFKEIQSYCMTNLTQTYKFLIVMTFVYAFCLQWLNDMYTVHVYIWNTTLYAMCRAIEMPTVSKIKQNEASTLKIRSTKWQETRSQVLIYQQCYMCFNENKSQCMANLHKHVLIFINRPRIKKLSRFDLFKTGLIVW